MAFDRVIHTKLFNILKTRKISKYLFGMLSLSLLSKYGVRWANSFWSYYETSKTIWQWCILSPILYIWCTGSLSAQLLSSIYGCHITGEWINYIWDADNMVLLPLSLKPLQTSIGTCFNFAGDNDKLYNETKTQCMIFWPQSCTQYALCTRYRLVRSHWSLLIKRFIFDTI